MAGSSLRRRVNALLPWVIGLGLLGYVLFPYRHAGPRAQLIAAFARAPAWAALVAILGALLAYVADTLATWLVLGWGHVRLRFRDVAALRGMTYFLAIINYSLGQASMIYVLTRAGLRALRGTGLVLFMMGINVLALLGFASISLALGAPAPPALRVVLAVLGGAFPLYLILLWIKPKALASRELLAPFFEMGPWGHVKALVVRLPHVAVMLVAQWVMMLAFGIRAPLGAAALYLPIVFAVAVLPISAQGLGTSQLILIECFSRYAPGDVQAQRATVLAYSLYLIVVWILTQVVIGLASLRTRFSRSLRAAARPMSQAAFERLDPPFGTTAASSEAHKEPKVGVGP